MVDKRNDVQIARKKRQQTKTYFRSVCCLHRVNGIVIFGYAEGIGRAIAMALATEGARAVPETQSTGLGPCQRVVQLAEKPCKMHKRIDGQIGR